MDENKPIKELTMFRLLGDESSVTLRWDSSVVMVEERQRGDEKSRVTLRSSLNSGSALEVLVDVVTAAVAK